MEQKITRKLHRLMCFSLFIDNCIRDIEMTRKPTFTYHVIDKYRMEIFLSVLY